MGIARQISVPREGLLPTPDNQFMMDEGERISRERLLKDAVASGDEFAWRTWYDETYAPVESFILWRCGGIRDLADDVLQETWMTVVRSIRRFDPTTGSFTAWVCGIAGNVLRNTLRGRRRRDRWQQSLNGVPEPNGPSEIGDLGRGERVAHALASLPDRYEAVLRAKYLLLHSVSEIAAQWKMTEKAVESLLSRARAAFREAYQTED